MAAVPSLEPVGLRIFPLHGIDRDPATGGVSCQCRAGAACKDIGKHPSVKWRDYDDDEIGPSGGFGIPTGSRNGFFVIDIDMKDGKNGRTALEALAAGRPIPETAGSLTPTGGAHLYLRAPEGLYIPNKRGLVEGVDIRGEGGFVVGPGSPHKNGGTYEAFEGPPHLPRGIANAPDWLLALVVVDPAAAKATPTQHRTIDPVSPEGVRAVAWAKDYLSKAEPAIEGQGGSDRLFEVACRLMLSSLPIDTLEHLIEDIYNPRCEPPWSQKEILHKLEDADEREKRPRGLPSPDFLLGLQNRTSNTAAKVADPAHEYKFEAGMRGSGEARKASIGEILSDLVDHVDWAGVFMHDTFRDRIVAVNPPMKLEAERKGLSDNDVQLVRVWFEYHGKKLQVADVRAAIEAAAKRHTFDPRIVWLLSLVWDGVPRLDRVLPDYFATKDTLYERTVGPKWFISLIARAMRPGCQSDCALVLEGLPGKKKTSAFRDGLLPDPTWYAETTHGVDSKDFYEGLRGVWIQAFDELDTLNRGAAARVNSMLTATRDRYRKSYGHYSEDFPRTCGFCGSTNSDQYALSDAMSRRLWPARVLHMLDVAKIRRDRDQLWAEAFHRWQAGEAWHIEDPQALATCEEEQAERIVATDSWEEQISAWIDDPTKVSWVATPPNAQGVVGGVLRGMKAPFDASKGITSADVLEHCLGKPKGQCATWDTTRVVAILRRLGLERKQIRVGKLRHWKYVRV